MKDILLTGNIKYVTNAMLEQFEGKQKIVLRGETSDRKFKDKRVVPYPYRESDAEYRGIFRSYNFHTVIYFSTVLDGQKRLYDELENLENTLYSAALSGVENFVYLTTNDYVEGIDSTRTKLLKTCEDICRQFVDEKSMNVLVLRVPYIFTMEETECQFIRIAKKALEEEIITLDGTAEQVVDYISDEDLGKLFFRIYEEPLTGFHVADVGGGNQMTMEKVGDILKVATGIESVKYCGYKEAVPTCLNDNSMREAYGWFTTNLLESNAAEIVKTFSENKKQIEKKKNLRLRNSKIRRAIFIGIEILFMFAVSEFLTSWTSENYRMDYVDFRLLFVVIIGTMHGTGAGIISSLLACVGYFSRDIFETNFQIIFFNIENWLPFAAYFLSGTIVGHVRDKKQEELRSLNEQQGILENKYIYLTELYSKTLENKEEFSRQLIGYEDSFGKIYRVVRNLNSVMTDKIFYEAVYAIEETLNTTSVAIYTIGKFSHFARLNVCSRDINDKLAKSLDLSLYPNLFEELKNNQNWYNAEGMKGYPAYAAPVWEDGELQGAILIWNANASQMKMDYFNKFSILTGLVQDALTRAIEYGQQQLIEGTRILKPEYFEEIISVKEQMGKEGISDSQLIEIEAGDMSLSELGETASKAIRNTDVLGMRKDEKVYLLLSQSNAKSLEIVQERLKAQGICLKI